MNRNELDSAKLDLALATNDEKLAAWARRYADDLLREIEDLMNNSTHDCDY